MGLSNLRKAAILDQSTTTQQENSRQMQELLSRVRNKPFWIWGKVDHFKAMGDNPHPKMHCCWNHIVGLPKKGDKEYPLFDYEYQIFQALEQPEYLNARLPTKEEEQRFEQLEKEADDKKKGNNIPTMNVLNKLKQERTKTLIHPQKVGHLLVLKSTGLGMTTFFLRYLSWLCMKDDKLKGQDIVIITGPRESLSRDLILRIKQQFLPFNITFDTRESTIFLNEVRIRSFPSNNLSAARGLESVALVFCDEAGFFGKDSQSEVIDVIERYAGKSRAKIILCSTPNRPGDLMHTILSQPYEQSFYKILKFDYTFGVGKVYSEEDIRIAKSSDSFQREYNLSFLSPQGNVFDSRMIDRAIELGNRYPPTINKLARHTMGVDPGFGSSSFAICILEYSDGLIKVAYADQFERSSFNYMVHKIWELKTLVGDLSNIYIDGANTEFIEAVKQELGEDSNWQRIHDKIAWAKKNSLNISDYMQTVPVSFAQESASMLSHCKNLIENDDSLVAINSKYDKLIAGLKGTVAVEYKITKSETPYCDLVDSFRLACKFFTLRK